MSIAVWVGDTITVFIYITLFRDRVYKVLQKEDSQVMSGPDWQEQSHRKATGALSLSSWWHVPSQPFQRCPGWSCTWPGFSGWASALSTTVSLEYDGCRKKQQESEQEGKWKQQKQNSQWQSNFTPQYGQTDSKAISKYASFIANMSFFSDN